MFFRTESGIRAHRCRTRLELGPAPAALTIVVDSGDGIPGAFRAARWSAASSRWAITPCWTASAWWRWWSGRATTTCSAEVGAIQALHQQLADLASQPPAALVIEADYRDFLDLARLKRALAGGHLARVLAEVTALHPGLPVIYAGNRKLANLWTYRFFAAVAARRADGRPPLVRELELRYDPMPREAGAGSGSGAPRWRS